MDLTQFDTTKKAEEGAELILRHPATEEELGVDPANPEDKSGAVTLRLLGTDSEVFQTASHRIANKRLEAAAKRGKAAALKTISSEKMEAESLDQLVACTVGWRNVDLDGKPLDFSKDNARLLFTRLKWVREQAEAFILSRANFLGNS